MSAAAGFRNGERIALVVLLVATLGVATMSFAYGEDVNAVMRFVLSAAVLIGLAWSLGEATEQIGRAVGPRVSGIMNATFGNLPELIIVLLLVKKANESEAFLEIAKASIAGSVLGNMLLVLGAAFLAGGIKNGVQRFGREFARSHVSMLTVAVVGLSVPTAIYHLDGEASQHIGGLSMATAVVLLGMYVVSLTYFLRSGVVDGESPPRWPLKASVLILALSAAGVAVMSEALVESIEKTAHDVGISPAFMGFVLIPIIGNIAEHFVAVQIAYRNDIDFAMTVALGSSVQVAVGLAPLAVLMSPLFGPQLDLNFPPLQVLALFLSVFFVATLTSDAESNWLDGLQLVAVYAIVAIAFWY